MEIATLNVGDVIQCNGDSVPGDLRHAWFIVRSIDEHGTSQLSWPYTTKACDELYVPREVAGRVMTSGRYRKHVQALIRQEREAGNKAARFATEYAPKATP